MPPDNRKNYRQKAALTVEACIAFPIFLMLMLTIFYFMRIVYTYALVQHAVSQTAKELSMYTYVYHVAGIGDINAGIQDASSAGTEQFNSDVESVVSFYEAFQSGDISGMSYDGTTDPVDILKNIGSVIVNEGSRELNNQFFDLIARPMIGSYIGADSAGNSADERLSLLRVKGGLEGIDLSGSSFFEDGNAIDIVACYTIDPLFPLDIVPEINLMNRAYVIGMSGSNVFE